MKKLSKNDVTLISKRLKHTNKYDYGNILIFGGSIGFFGAPSLSALAAFRAGSGLVSIALEEDDFSYFVNLNPEVMIKRYLDVEEVMKLTEKKDAILFGPGLEENLMNEKILRALLDLDIPLVIDATGLRILSKIGFDRRLSHVILTPHMGEARRLLNCDDPLSKISTLTDFGATVVLKSDVTIIAQGQNIVQLDYGHPSMAKAGSGDVLAGIIVSLLGQKYNLLEASKYGVYIHSLAGQIATAKYGEHSIIASDIIDSIGLALQRSVEE
ncbi:MAG: NAD(P)H-hydrate dehydratase [Bacilli bacterium]|nr:NAD(P)H-hydrate dehydratase [Bacilli bacterium]